MQVLRSTFAHGYKTCFCSPFHGPKTEKLLRFRNCLAVLILGAAAFCLLGTSLATAAVINLAWDSVSPQPNGYRVFMRSGTANYNYAQPAWQGTSTTCSIQHELQAGQTYYFVARAFAGTQESGDSNEVLYSAPLPPADTDGDGLSDRQEIDDYGTDPNRTDTDGDGVADGVEVAAGTDPLAASPPAEPHRLWLEAEDGDILSPMIIRDDGGASLEGCICVPNGTASAGGEAVYRFNITQAADYVFWGRVLAPSGQDDSFSVSVDGQSPFRWNTQQGTAWVWDQVADSSVQDPAVFHLQPGSHTLKILRREDGTHLDRILITNDSSYVPEGQGEPSGPPMTHVVIEAENGAPRVPMRALTDTDASSGHYVGVRQGDGSIASPSNDAGLVAYAFHVSEGGDYRVWGRVVAPSPKDDSFFAAMDEGVFERWNLPLSTAWTWDLVAGETADPRIFSLTPGTHTLYIMQREDGARIDKLVITKNAQYVPQGPGEPANQTPQPLTSSHIELEAEAGAVSAPMHIAAQPAASMGYCVGVPQGGGSITSPSNSAGVAVYEFNLAESGNYRVWGRVLAPSGNQDSFFAAMDDGAFARWNVQQSSDWTWDRVFTAGGADPQIFTLDAGPHTFYLMQREAGTLIDKLIITMDPDFIPE